MKLFITGRPGIGKTTFCLKLINLMKKEGISCGGVISREIRKEKSRTGFEFVDVTTNQVFSLSSVNGHGPRVGKYFVNLEGIQKAVNILRNSKAKVLFIDELGPMELKSSDFKILVNEIINSDRHTVIVVHRKIAYNYDCIELTESNRNKLHVDVLSQFLQSFKN